MSEIPASTPSSPPQAFAQGEACYRAGNFTQAAQIFAELCAMEPEHAGAVQMLGLCRLRLGAPEEGLGLLARARALAPGDPYVQLHYGLGLHAAGRHAEAAQQFRLCQSLLPGDPAPFLNLAAALLALGEVNPALDAARRARRRARNLPQAHYMVGLALLAAGRLAEAGESFAATLRLNPGLADGWVNLGVVRYRQNDIEAAKTAMRRALAAQPGHRAAAANLGAFLRLSGLVEAGENMLREVLTRDPGADEARLNLAVSLLQEERAGEALALLDDRPVPEEVHLARHWHLQRALALLQLGRAAEAPQALSSLGETPPELAPLVAWRRALLALARGDLAAARGEAEAMARALDTLPGLVPEHRIMAHFDLARFWSGQGENARAFDHWTEGHRLLGRFQPFSRAAHRAFVDAVIAGFDRVRLHDGLRAPNRDPAPVFIVGMPRSGTTLCEQIIGAHRDCFAAGERPDLGRAFTALGGGETAEAAARIAALDAPALDKAAASYLARLHALAPTAARIVDKMPGNFNYLGLAALLLPGARIIHCTRDPRDIGLSIFTYRFYGWHPYAHDLDDLGWYIGEHHRLMAHWRAVLPNPMLSVALKDWVADFAGTLHRVLDFLGLPDDPGCERFYEQDTRVRTASRAQVRQPVNARGLGRWRPYAAQLQRLIDALEDNHVALVDWKQDEFT